MHAGASLDLVHLFCHPLEVDVCALGNPDLPQLLAFSLVCSYCQHSVRRSLSDLAQLIIRIEEVHQFIRRPINY